MNIFGVEAAADGARVAVIETSLRSTRVSRLAYVPGGGEDAARVAARALAALGYDPQSDHVALALPGAALTSRAFGVPLTRPEQIQEALPYALESRLPFGAEDIVCGYAAIAAAAGESTILAVAARRDEVTMLIQRFAAAGVDPDMVVPAPLCAAAGGATHGARAVLVFADGAVTVTVVNPQGAPVGFHTAPLAPDADPAKIAAEARRAVMAARAGQPGLEAAFYELGGVAQGSALRAALADILGAPVRPLALPGADAPATGPGVGGAESRPLFAAALGAARIAAGLEPGLRLHLRYGALRKRRALAAKGSRALAAAALFGVGLLVWAAGWMMEGAALAARHAAQRAEARALFTAVMPGVTAAVSESQQLKAALAQAQAKARALGVSESGVDPFLDILLDVSRVKPAGAAVDIGELAYDASRLSLSGRTDSFEKVEQYRAAIDALPWAEKVTLDQAKSGAASGAVEFRLNVEIKP
ncbi:MAG: hypothetical protein HY804_09270 [Nitrospinae bacterium]|nr:hypothetical protein [Nitrospinota bacterium]